MMNCNICKGPMKPLFGAAWYCPQNCDRIVPTTATKGPGEYLYHPGSGEDILVVRKSEDKPKQWKFASFAYDPGAGGVQSIVDCLKAPLGTWARFEKQGPKSELLYGNVDRLGPVPIGTGSIVNYVLLYCLN
jgi:hypothetical protein